MLSMSGFLKKKLLDNKELPLKWQGFVGKASDYFTGKEVVDHGSVRGFSFALFKDYYDKNFELNLKIKLEYLRKSLDWNGELYVNMGIAAKDTNDYSMIQLNAEIPDTSAVYTCNCFHNRISTDGRTNSQVFTSKLDPSLDYVYMRFVHNATENKDYTYYSKDGKSWIFIHSFASLEEKFRDSAVIRLVQNPGEDSPIYLRLEDFTFHSDGKLVFGKVE